MYNENYIQHSPKAAAEPWVSDEGEFIRYRRNGMPEPVSHWAENRASEGIDRKSVSRLGMIVIIAWRDV